MKLQKIFVTGCVIISLTGCATSSLNSETSKEICAGWYDSLELPSRHDTKETARVMNEQFELQSVYCLNIK